MRITKATSVEESGQLQVGDWIHAVYKESGECITTNQLTAAQVSMLLAGPPGTAVRLVISKHAQPANPKPAEVAAEVELPTGGHDLCPHSDRNIDAHRCGK
mmetsp:Transcript_63122/g.131239  ORF Transcript_63122/g.131239 Transcript_63122/m.131239 type:complete len:101 (-) Transcript_63122:133-435(-)